MGAETRVVRICEHRSLLESDIGSQCWARVQRADRRIEREQGASVFDWSRAHAAKAKSLVGVLAVEGLTIEILPKVDEEGLDGNSAQRNLLWMLRRAGWLPFREAGLAGVAEEKGSLLEAFASLFAARLLEEWRRGPDRCYQGREENLRYLRGRLLISQNLRENAMRRERFFVAHDQLGEDTPLSRLLKAAVRRLLNIVRHRETRHLLGVLIEEMSFVRDVPISEARTIQAPLGRSSERFRPLRDFSQRVLGATSPSPRAADETSFSILFPMEQVFEAYVAETLRAWAPRLGRSRADVHIQGVGDRRHLLRGVNSGRRQLQLRPDVWVAPKRGRRGVVVDTKWKLPSEREETLGIAPTDVYQMLAYAQTYDAAVVVLVYPRYRGYAESHWDFPGARHRLQVAEWPVGGSLGQTEKAMFLEAGPWFEAAFEAGGV